MDNRRLFLAIALSVLILVGFEWLLPKQNHQALHQRAMQTTQATPSADAPHPVTDLAPPGTSPAPIPPPSHHARLPIEAPSVHGSIDLVGARLDDLLLTGYRETVRPTARRSACWSRRTRSSPTSCSSAGAAPAPAPRFRTAATLWTADQPRLTPATPVTLSWDNGAGLVFQIVLAVDRDYMFTVEQRVRNTTAQPVSLYPWSRVSRGYTPQVTGGYLVHEGPIAVVDGRLEQMSYSGLKSKSAEEGGTGWSATQVAGQESGWAGITDKYWLTAIIPDGDRPTVASYRYDASQGAGTYQVDFISPAALAVPAGGTLVSAAHVFAGAKEVHVLDAYQARLHITDFWKAIDFGWFAFLTKPIFYVLDWLNTALGNFGLALMAFTLIVKTLFFPLATKQFRSMGKMKLLAPKMQAVRERHKGDPVAMNQEMMTLYKQESVNPASGCLPMLVQIPVFWCLYKDLVVTIEMRHAPFFGWIHDLSEPDPTNVFNLFGLLPFDPSALSPFLHLGVWPMVLGGTMLLMQRMNPPPPDPAQARLFQLMPLIFMFVLARQPAGLVIYYCWNNLLTVAQQWLIQRQTRLGGARQVSTVSR